MENIMKKTIFVVAALAAATPAFASDFSGPRVEVTAGTDTASRNVSTKDVQYGAVAGYDLQLGKVVAGVEAGVDNILDRRNIAVAGRLGYAVNPSVLVYTKAGYANWKQAPTHQYEGLRLGAGVEAKLAGPLYTKVEYRHVDYGAVKTNGGLVGVGLRF
jgi:outer membrane immunogenic protein